MTTTARLDAAGRRRSPATYPDYLAGRSPNNKGRRYPADPPRVEEIMAVMRQAGDGPVGLRLRGLIVVLWRAGLRISEALALAEGDLEPGRGALLVRRGKGGRRREVGMDEWGWGQLRPWLELGPGCRLARCSACCGARQRALVGALGPDAIPPSGGEGRGAPALRAAPTPSRPRGGDGTRGGVAQRDPAPARAREPRHHLRLPGGDRRRRDRRDRARQACTADPGGDGAGPLVRRAGGRRTSGGRRLLVARRGSQFAS
jgi:Phage integrase family